MSSTEIEASTVTSHIKAYNSVASSASECGEILSVDFGSREEDSDKNGNFVERKHCRWAVKQIPGYQVPEYAGSPAALSWPGNFTGLRFIFAELPAIQYCKVKTDAKLVIPWHPAIPDFGSGLERSSYTLDLWSTTCGFRSSALGARRLRSSHARVSNMTLGKEQDEWKGEGMNEQPIEEHGEHEIVDWISAYKRTADFLQGARISVGRQQMRQKPKLEVVAHLSNNAHELSAASSSHNIAAKASLRQLSLHP
ncbi:hypothetical protein K438DRAFT_2075478 [Mycena galopus ATCC 62051]|nr:hypothetical protein K438DRAFT_2075478 [Mycena galopus ATCC 62051]